MPFTPYGTPLNQIASTPVGGFALQNATPTLLTYTTPNDGKQHRVQVIGEQVVSNAETGGGISLSFTDSGGTPRTQALLNGGLGAGFTAVGSIGPNMFTVAPNTTVSLVQTAALTLGAAIAYAELWGS